jgi:hypothetical protein
MRSRHCKRSESNRSLGNWEDGGARNLSQENCLAEYVARTCE